MAQETQRYKRTLNGSIGAGMKSVMGSSKKYYILEHKVSSKYHQAGESQEIIVDQIEIGRSSKCQVRYDESFSTVSRRHAAIVKDGENWKIIQLSSTNSTFLNGHKVKNEWYLQNGDEIQLSVNGPKLGFIIPTGKRATVGSIGLTRRMSLFRQQALRPYKTAIATLACLIVLLSCGGGYKLYDLHMKNQHLEAAAEKQSKEIVDANNRTAQLVKEVAAKGETISEMEKEIADLKNRKPQIIRQTITKTVTSGNVDNDAINKCLSNVFYIETIGYKITFPDGKETTIECGSGDNKIPKSSGTGFLLFDGRFVTARHVTEWWYFDLENKTFALFNLIANNGGKVVCYLIAISSSGTQLKLSSDQFVCDRSHDMEGHNEEGQKMTKCPLGNTDYAYTNIGRANGLLFNSSKSRSLERGTKLTVLGFPFGLGVNSAHDDINPIYGSVVVSANGLQNGIILTTDTNYEHGNSGGPVLYTNEKGELEVVGIVSASRGNNLGFIVPISAIK